MDEDVNPNEDINIAQVRNRPLLLTILCLASFVYFCLLSLLFLAGLFNASWITRVMNQYFATAHYTNVQTLLFFGAGFSLHVLAITGIWLIWNLRKTGYYFLALSCLIIAIYQLTNPGAAIASTAAYISLILLFGVFYNSLQPITPNRKRRQGDKSSPGNG